MAAFANHCTMYTFATTLTTVAACLQEGNGTKFGWLLKVLQGDPTVRKNCSSDREKLLKFEAEGPEFAKCLRSLEQFIQTVKGFSYLIS